MYCVCKICGKELKSKRAAHGHLITSHTNEYREAGFQQSKFMIYTEDKDHIGPADQEAEKPKKQYRYDVKPRGLRHLNLNIRDEAAAAAEVDPDFDEYFEYIDGDNNVYTEAEVIKRGWL